MVAGSEGLGHGGYSCRKRRFRARQRWFSVEKVHGTEDIVAGCEGLGHSIAVCRKGNIIARVARWVINEVRVV
ncbi:hypothetical protein AXF42_Ash020636 [Apostasia shenzhenica]|uniref:Uncharacterized protein n=1 Tax=Apostasia shenzhenica TaxID=1088818 RepID=A0A2H9ZY72_9ASPA|nr:hypothetical protein AXF42_Ash020636 [Apostasia shenzhenica]